MSPFDLAPYQLARRVGDVLDTLGVPWALGPGP